MITVDLPGGRFAPVAPDLARDPAVSEGALRLWAILFDYGLRRQEVDPEELAASWPGGSVAPRTVTRWLAQLHTAGWATWTRAQGARRSLDGRLHLHTHRVARDGEQPVNLGHHDPKSPKLRTPRSEVAQTSDTTIRSRPNFGHHDPSDGSYDPKLEENSASQRAKKPPLRSKKESGEIPPPPPTPSAAPGGGGGDAPTAGPGRATPHEPPAGAVYLAGEGFSDWAVRTFGHLPVETLAADVQRRRGDGQRTGGIVNAWKVCPPGAPPPSSAAPPPRAGLEPIQRHPDPKVRERWLRKARAEGADRAAVLAAFFQEHPDARPRPPARDAPAVRPGQ